MSASGICSGSKADLRMTVRRKDSQLVGRLICYTKFFFIIVTGKNILLNSSHCVQANVFG